MTAGFVVIGTTTFYQSIHDLRFFFTLLTVTLARGNGYVTIVVDNSPDPNVALCLRQAGAFVFEQERAGMGSSRRQVILTCEFYSAERLGAEPIILWLEPEKYDLIRFIPEIVKPITEGKAKIVYPSRTDASWATYPEYQIISEKAANAVYEQVTGRKIDVMFGPVAFSPSEVKWFFTYEAEKFGLSDRWDSHHIPPMQAIASGVKVETVPVDFIYPPEQKRIEENDEAMRAKREQQLSELSEAYRRVGEILGLS